MAASLSCAPTSAALSMLNAEGFFHGPITPHVAESMLRFNGITGTYLLRLCTEQSNQIGISVRGSDNVFHFLIAYKEPTFTFGKIKSEDFSVILEHIRSKPTLDVGKGASTERITLLHPYPRDVSEACIYEENPQSHIERKLSDDERRKQSVHNVSVSGREGWLTKLGRIKKNWKMRWFVLESSMLRYYKSPGAAKPCGDEIDMKDCIAVQLETVDGLRFCFSVRTPTRNLLMYSDSQEDADAWISVLRFKQARFGPAETQ